MPGGAKVLVVGVTGPSAAGSMMVTSVPWRVTLRICASPPDCRQYFNATRDTLTYEILETYKIGEKPQFTAKASGEKV